MDSSPRLDFRVLGPLEVFRDREPVDLGAPKQRALLALLLLRRGEVVSTDRLIDELWGERIPRAPAKSVQVYVSGLRKALGDGVIETRGHGYVLDVGDDAVDADRFELALARARTALDRGDAATSRELLRDALRLWRGSPFADFAYEDFARDETSRLEQLRLGALEERIEADLSLGRHAEVVPELDALVRDNPTRERLCRQLMIALYRSGRQAEALEIYRRARHALDEELGLEPGPELQQLERAILTHDPSIAAPKRLRPRPAATEKRRAGAILALGGALLLGALLATALLRSDERASLRASPNSLVAIDADSGNVETALPTGVRPAEVTSEAGSLWVANRADDTVTQIDPESRSVLSTTSPSTSVDALAAGSGALWIVDSRRGVLVRLDPHYRSVVRRLRIPRELTPSASPSAAVAVDAGAVWIANGRSKVVRIDPRTNTRVATIDVGNEPRAIAAGEGAVWVADQTDNTATRIDPAGGNAVTAVVPVGRAPSAIAIGPRDVWVANTGDDSVSRINSETASVVAKIAVGARPTAIAVGKDGVWVANSVDGTVSRIDPSTNRVADTIDIGHLPQGMTLVDGKVWVSVGAATRPSPTPTGSAAKDALTVAIPGDPGALDPALDEDPVRSYATCGLLLNYPDEPAPSGALLRPDLARAPPRISRDGRTYTFELRPGFRFSPPSNEPVTAAAFKRSIDRARDPRMHSVAADLVRDVSSVKARGETLVVNLTAPAPSLPARLATSYFCAVPASTPIDPQGVDAVPSAGPYYVASHEPDHALVLRRNPGYMGFRARRVGEIRYEIGASEEGAVKMTEAGTVDYVSPSSSGDPARSAGPGTQLARRYGPNSAAARAGHQRYFTTPDLSVFYLLFNTHRPTFADARLRRAVNFAINRGELAANPGLPDSARPTDQYIPPGVSGFENAAVYPLGGPNIRRAKRLAGSRHRSATLYVCSNANCARNAETLRRNLRAIGIELDVRRFSTPTLLDQVADRRHPYDIAMVGWVSSYADPFEFINVPFGPGGYLSASAPVSDPALKARIAAAARLTGVRRARAYARLDRAIAVGPAPAAPFANGTVNHFFSARVGCQFEHPIYGVDLAALCIR